MVLVGSCEEEEEESVGDLGQSSLPESQSGNEPEDEPDVNCKDWPALEGAVALDSAQTDRDEEEEELEVGEEEEKEEEELEVGEEEEKEEEEEEEEAEAGETAEELGRARCSCIIPVIHHCSRQGMNVAVCQTVPPCAVLQLRTSNVFYCCLLPLPSTTPSHLQCQWTLF